MRLPIQSMQAVRIRPLEAEEQQWYRSVIIDFEEDDELLVLMPDEKDLEKQNHAGEGEAADEATANSGVGVQVEEASAEGEATGEGIEEGEGGEAGAEADGEAESEEIPESIGDDELVKPPPFQRGTRLEVEISFPDGIRRFNSSVRRLEFKHGGAMRIEWPTEGTRIQRRDYVRVEVTCRAIAWYREEGDTSLKQLNGFTMDLSAGGVRLRLPQPLPEEMRIEIEIQKPELEAQTLQGRVVRSGEIKMERDDRQQWYWVAIEFVGVDEGLRNQMTQLVFDIQREHRLRSLG